MSLRKTDHRARRKVPLKYSTTFQNGAKCPSAADFSEKRCDLKIGFEDTPGRHLVTQTDRLNVTAADVSLIGKVDRAFDRIWVGEGKEPKKQQGSGGKSY